MKPQRFALLFTLCALPALAAPRPGQHLPTGAEQSVRERQIDIKALAADLVVDLKRQTVAGDVTVTFSPLRDGIGPLMLDAAELEIDSVGLVTPDGETALDFHAGNRQLAIALPSGIGAGDETAIRIAYKAQPESGLYFFKQTGARAAEAWNYGEGGRHYNWLPLYNDTNDRFAVDMRITVDQPYTALGNGTLQDVQTRRDGSRTFHWVQEQPIANYLLAFNVGEFVEVPLRAASVGDRKIPLSAWTHAGDEEKAAYSFRNTPAMVEYFSALLGYDYAWDKYDQVTLRNFSGAMETTTMVGFSEGTLGQQGDMRDDGQRLDKPVAVWNRDDTISHELAHHWFGDLVTCRSIASIWLNESFASYMHTVWNGHNSGDDDLTYQRWRYLQVYLDFVRTTGEIRPLEYFNFDSSDDMYTSEITYIKGAIVLHQLRHFLGDESFYRGLKQYLHGHAFSEVDSYDLQRALEEATGRNLNWFFEDWVRGGGGYPALSVSHSWSAERGAVDLSISQVQAMLPFQDLFEVPIDVEVVTATGSSVHRLTLSEETMNVALPADGEPLMVVVDQGSWLVADIHHELTVQQLAYQLENGDVAAALRAARQLAEDYPRQAAAVSALSGILHNRGRYWGLRQESALALGAMGGEDAVASLVAAAALPDVRIRRAAVIALGRAGGKRSEEALANAIANDSAEEVIGAAIVAIGKMQVPTASSLLLPQLDRESRYNDVIRHSALLGLAELNDPALAPSFRRFIDEPYNRDVRMAAIEGWASAAANDPALARELRRLASDPDNGLRAIALTSLGELHRADDVEFLRDYSESATDRYLQNLASAAAETIAEFTGK